jgi:hypothetical protein
LHPLETNRKSGFFSGFHWNLRNENNGIVSS